MMTEPKWLTDMKRARERKPNPTGQDEKLRAAVERVVDAAPPLTEDQRARLRLLLRIEK